MHIPASFDYPDRLPNEPPSSLAQLSSIQQLCPSIPYATLKKLGTHQATCLIYSIRNAHEIMQTTIDACTTYIRTHQEDSPETPISFPLTAAVLGATLGMDIT